MNDPWIAGVNALRQSLDVGRITPAQYEEMYAAIARAAEQDSAACAVDGCDRPAFIGTRCAHHTTKADIRAALGELR